MSGKVWPAAIAQLVEHSTTDHKFEGLNPAATDKVGAATFSIMTLSITIISIKALSIMCLFTTLSINDTQHSYIKPNYTQYWVSLC